MPFYLGAVGSTNRAPRKKAPHEEGLGNRDNNKDQGVSMVNVGAVAGMAPVASTTLNVTSPVALHEGAFGHATTKYPPDALTVTDALLAVTGPLGMALITVPTNGLPDDTV